MGQQDGAAGWGSRILHLEGCSTQGCMAVVGHPDVLPCPSALSHTFPGQAGAQALLLLLSIPIWQTAIPFSLEFCF